MNIAARSLNERPTGVAAASCSRSLHANPFKGLRVGLIGPQAPPAGGMANQTRQLGELLRGAGAEVRVVASNAAYRPAWVQGVRGVRAGWRLMFFVADLWRTAARCDIFHVMASSGWSWHLFAVPAILIGKLRRVPVVVNYRGGGAAAFLERSATVVRLALGGLHSSSFPRSSWPRYSRVSA